jgi:3-methyladenine DNA glycosylase AlkD
MQSHYVKTIIDSLKPHEDAIRAVQMKKYMREKFDFFGIPSPQLRSITAPFLRKENQPSVQHLPATMYELWDLPQREAQYFALDLLKRYLKRCPLAWGGLIENLVVKKSWWDTVDALASWDAGAYFRSYTDQITHYIPAWMDSGNIGLQRTCLLFQLRYKENTDFELLKSLIRSLASSEEFFIQKAIGWSLREYSKTFPEKVLEFVEEQPLASLSYREATRIALKKRSSNT